MITGTIKDGLFTPDEPLSKWEGKRCILKIEKDKGSNKQMRYYRGYLVAMIAEHTGYTKTEVHGIVADLFLRVQVGLFPRTRSTTELDTAQFEKYCENIRRWAMTKLNLFLNLPNEYWEV